MLRDPGRRYVAGAVTVLDVLPPPLARRGAAAARAAVLATLDGRPDLAGELGRRGLARVGDLTRAGVPVTRTPVAGDWLADPDHWRRLGDRLAVAVAEHAVAHPLAAGVPVEQLRRQLDLPDRLLVEALVRSPLRLVAGRVVATGTAALPEPVARALALVGEDYAAHPFRAPDAARLAAVGLGAREIGAAVRAGALLRLTGNVLLPPGAPHQAVRVLSGLPQPFTLSAARQALDTTRRVAVPLLELLDRRGLTRRLPDDARVVVVD